MHGAVHQNQHDQENLDGPEMRPHDLREQLLVAGHETPGLFPEVDEVLQVVDQHGHQHVNRRFPGDVVDQRFVWIPIDERQQVRHQHRLAEDQGRQRDLPRRAGRDPGALEHQDADKRDEVERDEEKDRRREQRFELLFQFRGEFAHGSGLLILLKLQWWEVLYSRSGGDHLMPLRPRSLAMWRYLAAHPGRLVTKVEVLNLSHFIAHKTWLSHGVSPHRLRAHRVQRCEPLRGSTVARVPPLQPSTNC